MYIQYRGKSDLPFSRRSFQIPMRARQAKVWLHVDKQETALDIAVETRREADFVDAGLYDGVGELALLADSLPPLPGHGACVSVTAAPTEWINAADCVLPLFARLGFKAHISDRTLRVEFLSPSDHALKALGVAFLALDLSTRGNAPERVLADVQRSAVLLFDERAEELLELLDPGRGGARLKQLLKLKAPAPRDVEREVEARKVLKQLGVNDVVQFHCGTGRFLRDFSAALSLKTAIGIEPSLVRVAAGTAHESAVKIYHGSVIEPPEGLPSGLTALLIDALPSSESVSRIERASEVLFGQYQFPWVLCLESERWPRQKLIEWSESISQRFAYRAKHWLVQGRNTAVLFRRQKSLRSAHVTTTGGPRIIETKLRPKVRISGDQWARTVEAFSLRTVDPRWLLYLPCGLASVQSNRSDQTLEHPLDALAYYRGERIPSVVVELKHMGSRAIAIICRDEDAGLRRFGVPALGCVYTRNGRPFFDNAEPFLTSVRDGLSRADFWNKFRTDWVCLDGELMPWTLKAERLVEETHVATALNGLAMLNAMAKSTNRKTAEDVERWKARQRCLEKYVHVVEHYKVAGEADASFAPFHLIATEGRAFFDKNHLWHMTTLGHLAKKAGAPLVPTPYRHVRLSCTAAISELCMWWEELCTAGNEGVVVKPLYFLPKGRRGLAQPGIKCRSREHLRLVYGPEYDLPENRLRLLDRPALSRRRAKHRRVLQQLALSVEGVERFVRGEDLARVKECVRAILALEHHSREPTAVGE